MVSNELVEQLRKLDCVYKLQIIQLLAAELANEENKYLDNINYILFIYQSFAS